jgi:hypothetical protein
MNKAGKAYIIEFGLAMIVAYPVVLILSVMLLQRYPESIWRVPLALAPVIPPLFGMRAFLRFLGRMDELERRIQLEAIGFAFGVTLVVVMTAGFLENAGVPRVSGIWIGPLMIALWGIGAALASRRYR